ncbi:MAG: hypothetical protein WKG07_07020 [Hymenobacter sp.]
MPVEFHLHAGAEADSTGLRGLPLDLPVGSVLYTDAGYTDYVAEDVFEEASGSRQQTCAAQKQQAAPPSGPKLSDSVFSQRY